VQFAAIVCTGTAIGAEQQGTYQQVSGQFTSNRLPVARSANPTHVIDGSSETVLVEPMLRSDNYPLTHNTDDNWWRH
jgi:hypothetical protein